MSDADLKKLGMYSNTHEYLLLKTDIVNAITELPPHVIRLGELIDLIFSKEDEKDKKTGGKSAIKMAIESALNKTLYIVANGGYSWGRKNKDEEVMSQTKLTKTQIRNLPDLELYNKAKGVYELVKDKDLSGWGIDTVTVQLLKTQAESFKKAIGSISSSRSDKSGVSKTVTQLFAETDDLLKNDIDPIVNGQIEKSSEFYNGYKSACVIWDRFGSRKSTVEEPKDKVK